METKLLKKVSKFTSSTIAHEMRSDNDSPYMSVKPEIERNSRNMHLPEGRGVNV